MRDATSDRRRRPILLPGGLEAATLAADDAAPGGAAPADLGRAAPTGKIT